MNVVPLWTGGSHHRRTVERGREQRIGQGAYGRLAIFFSGCIGTSFIVVGVVVMLIMFMHLHGGRSGLKDGDSISGSDPMSSD